MCTLWIWTSPNCRVFTTGRFARSDHLAFTLAALSHWTPHNPLRLLSLNLDCWLSSFSNILFSPAMGVCVTPFWFWWPYRSCSVSDCFGRCVGVNLFSFLADLQCSFTGGSHDSRSSMPAPTEVWPFPPLCLLSRWMVCGITATGSDTFASGFLWWDSDGAPGALTFPSFIIGGRVW